MDTLTLLAINVIVLIVLLFIGSGGSGEARWPRSSRPKPPSSPPPVPAPPPPPVGEVRPPREWPKQDPEPPTPQGMKIPSGGEVVIRSIPDPTPGEAWFERRLQRAEKMRDEAQTGTYKHGYWKGFVDGMIAALASFEMDRRRS